ncbi:MAG: hypothetical protein AAGC60_09890 [Acidobacteriota bacterium]
MIRPSILRSLALLASVVLLTPLAVAAEDFAGIELGMDAGPATLSAFDEYATALDSTGDRTLVQMAASARDALVAVQGRDIEGFVAAKAVFAYYAETLTDPQRDLLAKVHEHLAPAPSVDFLGGSQKINVTAGCGSEIRCDNGSSLSCGCSNASGTCSFDKNANSWGGSITCNCGGSTTTRSCPFVGEVCDPPCSIQCPSGIGACVDGRRNLCLCAQ